MKNAKHEFLKSKLESMEKAFQKLNSDFNDIREAMNDVTIIEPTNRYAIRKIICKHYRISEWEFSSKNRKREMADARTCFLFISVVLNGDDVREATDFISKDRSTFYHCYDKHFELYEFDARYKDTFGDIVSNLKITYDHEKEKRKKEAIAKQSSSKKRKTPNPSRQTK